MVKYKIDKTFEFKVTNDYGTILAEGNLIFKSFRKMYSFALKLYKQYNGENIKVNIINNNVADTRKSL